MEQTKHKRAIVSKVNNNWRIPTKNKTLAQLHYYNTWKGTNMQTDVITISVATCNTNERVLWQGSPKVSKFVTGKYDNLLIMTRLCIEWHTITKIMHVGQLLSAIARQDDRSSHDESLLNCVTVQTEAMEGWQKLHTITDLARVVCYNQQVNSQTTPRKILTIKIIKWINLIVSIQVTCIYYLMHIG